MFCSDFIYSHCVVRWRNRCAIARGTGRPESLPTRKTESKMSYPSYFNYTLQGQGPLSSVRFHQFHPSSIRKVVSPTYI